MKLLAFGQVLLLAASAAAADMPVQARVNDVHAIVWGNYIQRQNGLLLTRLDLAGRPFYPAGVRESPSIEDCALYGSMYLDAMLARHAATGKPGAAVRARTLLGGLLRTATVTGSPGLLARGVHPDGVWRYFHSPLATPEEKSRIRSAVSAFLERLERDAWTVRNERGAPTRFGDVGALYPTRAERLLAFLLAAADITGDSRWLQAYQREKVSRLGLCRSYTAKMGEPWVQVQNAMALRILLDLARDPADRAVFAQGARTCADACRPFLRGYRKIQRPDGRFMNRREMAAAGVWSERALTDALRNPFDAAAVILLLDRSEYYAEAVDAYREILLGVDFAELRYVGFVFPAEYNYWLAVGRKQLPYDPAADGESRDESYRILRQDVYANPGAVSLR
jgi:hypothetical protein